MLKLGSTEIHSSRGVQQGDPIGPALFALAVHDDILQAKAHTEQLLPNRLNFVAFFLDDGVAAGSSRAVKCFVDTLASKLSEKGLSANIDKCIVVPAALSNTTVQESEFPGMKFVNDGNFKLLGAAVGDTNVCMGHVRKRMNNAAKLLQATPQMSSKQAGLLVMRHCGSFCKLSHAARVTQPAQIRDGLE